MQVPKLPVLFCFSFDYKFPSMREMPRLTYMGLLGQNNRDWWVVGFWIIKNIFAPLYL